MFYILCVLTRLKNLSILKAVHSTKKQNDGWTQKSRTSRQIIKKKFTGLLGYFKLCAAKSSSKLQRQLLIHNSSYNCQTRLKFDHNWMKFFLMEHSYISASLAFARTSGLQKYKNCWKKTNSNNALQLENDFKKDFIPL